MDNVEYQRGVSTRNEPRICHLQIGQGKTGVDFQFVTN